MTRRDIALLVYGIVVALGGLALMLLAVNYLVALAS